MAGLSLQSRICALHYFTCIGDRTDQEHSEPDYETFLSGESPWALTRTNLKLDAFRPS